MEDSGDVPVIRPLRPKPHWGIARMATRPVSVIEFAGYRRRAEELLTAGERDAVIDLIAYEPACGEIIPGSGGLRKVRVGRDGMGKRGGARVVYYFYNESFPILLLALYAKNEKDDLTAAEKRELAASIKVKVTQWQRK
jgi:RelE toxin of RelE / RelB toxin-antitoxin system